MIFDNLFDKKFTFLDAVKILLLIVTMFSTWNVVDLMTPNTSLAFVRELAAVGVVEGAFLGFEMATAKAKTKRQSDWATTGFFCSLIVIGLFAATSGLLEFGGANLLAQSAGNWLNLAWTVKDAIMVGSLTVLVMWIVALASIYRFYSLNDPDKKAELQRNEITGDVTTESNNALKTALTMAQPVIATFRAMAQVKDDYKTELTPAQINRLQAAMSKQYQAPFESPAEELAPHRPMSQPTPPIHYQPDKFDSQVGHVDYTPSGKPVTVVVDKTDKNGRTIVFDDNGKFLGKFADKDGNVWTSYWQTDLDLATRQPEQFSHLSRPNGTVHTQGNEDFIRFDRIPADPEMPFIPAPSYRPQSDIPEWIQEAFDAEKKTEGPATGGADFHKE